LIPAPLEVDRGEVCFSGPLEFEATIVHDIEGLWIRGRLAEVTDPSDTEIDTVRVRVEVVGEGVAPEQGLVNLESDAFVFLDLGKNIYPLGKEPKLDCVLYLACDELLRMPDSEISIEITAVDSHIVPVPTPSDDLTISWEYFDGKKWRPFGRSGPRGIRPGAADFGFHDTTKAFTQSGVVSFQRPRDMEPCEVNGEPAFWLRARVEQGDFGTAGNYTLDNDNWVLKTTGHFVPPCSSRSVSDHEKTTAKCVTLSSSMIFNSRMSQRTLEPTSLFFNRSLRNPKSRRPFISVSWANRPIFRWGSISNWQKTSVPDPFPMIKRRS